MYFSFSRLCFSSVLVAPSITEGETSSDTDVREGNDVSLKCSAHGSPTPSIKWRREDDGEIPVENGKGLILRIYHFFQS